RAGIRDRSTDPTGLARNRSNVDDAAPPPLTHRTRGKACVVKRAAEVYVQHLRPLGIRHSLDRPTADHTRVVDEYVDGPQRAGTSRGGVRDLIGILHVGNARHCCTPQPADLHHHLLEESAVTAHQCRVGTSAGELERHGSTDAAASARHQCHPTINAKRATLDRYFVSRWSAHRMFAGTPSPRKIASAAATCVWPPQRVNIRWPGNSASTSS